MAHKLLISLINSKLFYYKTRDGKDRRGYFYPEEEICKLYINLSMTYNILKMTPIIARFPHRLISFLHDVMNQKYESLKCENWRVKIELELPII